MKKICSTKSIAALFAIGLGVIGTIEVNAQNARLQLIHNAAGIALDTVDVYVNDTKFDDVAFRTATALQTLPAGTYNLNLNHKTSADSGDQVLARFTFTLNANSGNVIMVNGVENSASYATNPDSRNTEVSIVHRRNVIFTSSNPANLAATVFHGATDAPGVTISTRPAGPLAFTNVRYGDTSNNVFIAAQPTFIDVRITSTNSIFKSYLAPLSTFGRRSLVVFASGFVDPTTNQNGAGFGLFAVDTNGGAAIQIPEAFRVQFVHNAADTSFDSVDVWLNSTKVASNLGFKRATPMLSFTAGTYNINITRKGSANENTNVLTQLTAVPLNSGRTYLGIVNGVIDTTLYGTNPGGIDRSISISGTDQYAEVATAGSVTLSYFNGVADAGETSLSRGTTTPVNLFTDVEFNEFAAPVTIPTTATTAYVLRESIAGELNRTFRLRLPTSFGGRVGTLVSAGYNTSNNPASAPKSSYYIVFTDGTIQPIEELNAFVQIIHASADPAVSTVDVYINGVKALDDFVYPSATTFLPIVPYKPAEVKIAPANSVDTSTAFFTTSITADSSRYHYAIATGVRNPGAFAPNPNGVNTSFTIVLNNQARTLAALNTKNIDLMYFHSITDAPLTTSKGFNQTQFLSKDNAYKTFHGYRAHAAFDDILFELKDAVADTLLYRGYANLTSHQGKTGLVFAGGFITAAAGVTPRMFIAWPEGGVDTIGLSSTTFVKPNSINESTINVYPNPAGTLTSVVFNSEKQGEMTVTLYDLTGKVISTQLDTIRKGENTIEIALDRIQAGMYLIQLNMNGETFTKKFHVVK